MKGGSTPKHGEAKKARTVYTTGDSWENLDKIANDFLISRSELVELIGQGRLIVTRPEKTPS
jgi:hypothetical protein